MALFEVATQASSKAPSVAPLLEAGGYPARVCRIIDLGKQPGSDQYPAPQYKMRVTFELLEEFMVETDDKGVTIVVQDESEGAEPGDMVPKYILDKPRWFDFDFTYNADGFMGDNSHILKFMKAVDALEVAANVEQGIVGHPAKPLAELLGEPLVVGLITYNKKSGKRAGQTDNKIATFSPMKTKEKRAAKPLVNSTLLFNLGAPDLEVFNKLPGGDSKYAVKNIILANLEFNGSELQRLMGIAPTAQEPVVNAASEAQVDAALAAELEAQRLAREAKAAAAAEGGDQAAGAIPF